MAKDKKSKDPQFRTTKIAPALLAALPTQARTVNFQNFIHGQTLKHPFTLDGFTFASPFSATPFKIIDSTSYGEPALENTWLTTGLGLSANGIFVQLPAVADLCSISIVPDLAATATKQVRFEWFDSNGVLLGDAEFGSANPLPQYVPYTHVVNVPGVAMLAVYSNEETTLCRVQAL